MCYAVITFLLLKFLIFLLNNCCVLFLDFYVPRIKASLNMIDPLGTWGLLQPAQYLHLGTISRFPVFLILLHLSGCGYDVWMCSSSVLLLLLSPDYDQPPQQLQKEFPQ